MTPFSIWEGLSDTQKILILIAGFFAKFSENFVNFCLHMVDN